MTADQPRPLRSAARFGEREFAGFLLRAATRAMGFTRADLSRPVIGIAQTWSEFNNCNAHLREVAEAVKRGVWQAGGFPLEFPTISLGELFVRPTTMLYRNLMAMDTEEMVRAHPIDGVVLLANCDKTTPAQLMGAASADMPAILLTGGPTISGRFRGQNLGACTDCRRLWNEYRAGRIGEAELEEIEDGIYRSRGHCTVMGTASTMAAVGEALGMSLPGSAAIPAPDARRLQLAEAVGRAIVRAVELDLRPSRILTRAAFENAIRAIMALGGSTNAVVHLTAIAGRVGIDLSLDLFDRLSRETPTLVNLKPSGDYQMEELFEAGGVPAVLKEIAPLLHLDALTVTGRTLGEEIASAQVRDRRVIRSLADPLDPEGGIAVLRGNLAPRGAVIKQSAASPHLLRHRGRAVVFTSVDDLERRIDDSALEVTPDSVLVLQNAGPVGGPGMPEAGFLPIPKRLLAAGVRDLVRISDARMSGTAFGTIVLHVTPEAAVGGPLAAVRDGDWISLDVPNRTLTLEVSDAELAARLAGHRRPELPRRGYWRLYAEHVLQADQGCDFDFLRA